MVTILSFSFQLLSCNPVFFISNPSRKLFPSLVRTTLPQFAMGDEPHYKCVVASLEFFMSRGDTGSCSAKGALASRLVRFSGGGGGGGCGRGGLAAPPPPLCRSCRTIGGCSGRFGTVGLSALLGGGGLCGLSAGLSGGGALGRSGRGLLGFSGFSGLCSVTPVNEG